MGSKRINELMPLLLQEVMAEPVLKKRLFQVKI